MIRVQRRSLQSMTALAGFLLWFFLFASPAVADYCASNGRIVTYEWIDTVTLEDSSNVSGANGGYADFTDQTFTLTYGENAVSLVPGFRYSAYLEYWRIWIDFNQDEIFDATELVLAQSSRAAISSQIVIPDSALGGTTRMRVSMKWGGLPPSCGTFTYGEVEDYTVTIGESTPALGKISDMVAGNNPDVVFAIDQDHQQLYTISTSLQRIVDTVALPDSQPVAMAYAADTNRLYIVSANTGKITVYDVATATLSQLPVTLSGVGQDIVVAPSLGRLYVLSPNGYDAFLTMIDANTGAILLETSVGGSSLVLDEGTQTLFTANRGLSPSTIYKYSVADDTLTLVQQITSGGNGREIAISPDGGHVVLPCGGGNGDGYTIFDYDATDLNRVFGEWDVGTYPKLAAFSPDGRVLYGLNGDPYDNYLYVMDASSYGEIRKLEFPEADAYAVMTPNSDGSVVVAFSYDTYNNSGHALYFFTDVQPADDPSPIELGKISDMVAGGPADIVYAIDQDHAALYTISTTAQAIVSSILLPDSQPVAMAYSPVSDCVYIVSAFSSHVTVVDMATQEISQVAFSAILTGRDIAIAPDRGLLFVLSPNNYSSYLTVVDVTSGEILLETSVGGSSIAVDGSTGNVFTATSGLSPSTIYKYQYSDATLALIQQISAGSNGRTINISPNGEHVVLPCGGGNGSGYTIFDFDAGDLTHVFGEWDVGTYPKVAGFSPDSTLFYGTNGSAYDQYLYVMDALTYAQIRKIAFPNANSYAVFTPSADGSMVVGFSYDTYAANAHSLYFFSNVGP